MMEGTSVDARNNKFLIGWRMLRPFTLTASMIPVLIGTGLALVQSHFHSGLFFSFLTASVLIQAATNMFNEYFDYKRGLDSKEMVGIAGTIVHDGIRPKTVLTLAWVFIFTAFLLGIYICAMTSWWIALIGTLCIAVAYFYSGGPVPLAYTPFGELAAAIAMGPVIVLLAYYVQTRAITGEATAASIPIGLLIGAILLGNNIRDMDQDRAGGRKTIAILLGRRRAGVLFAGVFTLTYMVVLTLIASRALTPWALVVLLTVPSAVVVARMFFRFHEPSQLHPAVKGTAVLLFRFGALMFASMLASVWIH